MKILVKDREDIFCMSKITEKRAVESRTGKVHDFIYFSLCLDSHAPRIKFYGGTRETKSTRTAPSMSFGVTGNPKVIMFDWMNKKNCPRAFDDEVIKDLKDFIIRNRPILLLVWFDKLDEADALEYFHGIIDWDELIACIEWEDNQIEHICKTMDQLHEQCMKYNMYQF